MRVDYIVINSMLDTLEIAQEAITRFRSTPSPTLSVFDGLIVEERDDQVMGGGEVRVYKLPNGYGLNGINTHQAHRFPYSWEFAVLEPHPDNVAEFGDVVFDTPLTDTVCVCVTETDAANFLYRAVLWALKTAPNNLPSSVG